MTVEVPRKLIEELRSPSRKRTVKTILRENWSLVENVDKSLKEIEDLNLPILVIFILQNFLMTVSLIVSPKKVSMRKQKARNEHEDVLEFEEDLREAQKNWKLFMKKYEKTIKMVVEIAKKNDKVDFHGELWQRTRFQKLASSVINLYNNFQSKTVHYLPKTRFIFALIAFTARWTILPVFNVSQKISQRIARPLRDSESENDEELVGNEEDDILNGNGVENAHKNGKNHSFSQKQEKDRVFNEQLSKFHLKIQNSHKSLAEKEQEWQEKSTQFQKEVRARLEVQEKRLLDELENFEKEKRARRLQEEEDFRGRLEKQNTDFENLMTKIEEDRKALEDEEQEKLFELCENQDKALLDLLDSHDPSSIHWTDHEDYWSDRLQILRSSLSAVRAEYWNFESYLKQYIAMPQDAPNFVKIVYKMESASFGRTVTRAKGIIENEQEFFESLTEKYSDDTFLRILMNTTSKVATQLENIILELWNVAIDSAAGDYEDVGHLRSTVLDVDPHLIPTTWRLKGICNSMNPAEVSNGSENGAVMANGHH